jgi:HEAT repeat protein
MGTIRPVLLGVSLLLSSGEVPPAAPPDPAHLREMLYDRQHPLQQSQAALLLIQSQVQEAGPIIHQGLRQTDAPDVFQALAEALRLGRDARFTDDLLAVLAGGPPALRPVVAEALGVLADARLILRLQTLAEDAKADPAARQAAVSALGRSSRKGALVVLLDQLSSSDETVRQAAADALAELTGQPYGLDVARWRAWWEPHKDLSDEHWLEERLAYQASRARRLEGELERARTQVVRLHQQLFTRLPAGDRLGYVQSLVDSDDPAVRALVVGWTADLLATADAVGQRSLSELLLRLSQDGNIEVGRAAVLALGRVRDPRAFERLETLLRQGEPAVRAAAARALGQQVRGPGAEALARQRQVVPALQKALDDSALEVVIEAAESLGALGLPESGPVLAVLLRHPSKPVRQTAALALERVADLGCLDGLIAALDDPVVTVRFSVVGALAHAAGDGRALTDSQRVQLLARLEGVLLRDADPGVRSRAATVLGECGSPLVLPTLWRRILTAEDARVQEKAWGAVVEVIARAGSFDLLQEWDRTLADARQPDRRLQLLTEVTTRWQKREDLRAVAAAAADLLVAAQLEQGKWAAALPILRELLARPAGDMILERRLHWLLTAGELALKEGNRAEAQHVVQDAQPYLKGKSVLASEFARLDRTARP